MLKASQANSQEPSTEQPWLKKVRALEPGLWRYLRTHSLAFNLSLANLSLAPLASLFTVLAIGLCLSFPATLYLFIKNIQQLNPDWDSNAAISLYINPQSSPAQLAPILAKIEEFPFITKVVHISPEHALEEFKEASGLQDMLALLPENPLPRVITLQIENPKAHHADILLLRETLAQYSQVRQAIFDYEWVDKLDQLLGFGKKMTYCLAGIIGLGVILIIGNTIRLAMEKHKDEIEVMNLIGATTAFIRRPFLYRGFLYGALGGMVATLIIHFLVYILRRPSEEVISLFDGVFLLENINAADTLTLLLTSALLGWLGALVAFMQQNRHFSLPKR